MLKHKQFKALVIFKEWVKVEDTKTFEPITEPVEVLVEYEELTGNHILRLRHNPQIFTPKEELWLRDNKHFTILMKQPVKR